jgi:hypothetical protein
MEKLFRFRSSESKLRREHNVMRSRRLSPNRSNPLSSVWTTSGMTERTIDTPDLLPVGSRRKRH